MLFTLPILASLLSLPTTLAAPTPGPGPAPFAFAYAPPPTADAGQWQGDKLQALRDAAIFSAGKQAHVGRSGGPDKIKIRRRTGTGMHGHSNFDARAGKRKRACAAKGQVPVQAPATTTTLAPVYVAQPAQTGASTTTIAEAAASEYSVESTAPEASASSSEAATAPAASESAPSWSSGGGVGGAVDAIFPVHVNSRWTTAQSEGDALSFDAAFKPLAAGRLPDSTPAPDGSYGLHASFPSGTYKLTSAGFSFYSPGPSSVDVSSATEVTLSYSVYFSDGFDFVKGGKLPGLYGGASMDEAKSCSGGRQEDRGRCFSARLMWRTGGMGEFYNYYPTDVQQGGGYCETGPMSHCDAKFGDSIGRGAFTFPSGKWTTVTQRLKLNSPASASNGEQELWVDGQQVINLSGLRIRTTDETKIYGVMAQTFFGGGDESWASTKDQDAWFNDWSLGVIA